MIKTRRIRKVKNFSQWFGFLLPVMVKRTAPLALPILLKSKWIIILLLVLSILLGVIPTVKSDLEAGILDQANSVISTASHPQTTPLLEIRLQRFDQTPNSSADIGDTIASTLFRGLTLGGAFLFYLGILVCAFGIHFWSTVAQAKITARVFAALRGAALREGLVTDPSDLPSWSNVAGQYAMGVHQGADNISGTYGYLLEVGQHLFSLTTTLLLVAARSSIIALCCLIVAVLQVLLSVLQASRLKKKREELDEKRNDLVARTEDVLDKREIILAYEQQDRYTEKLGQLTQVYAEVGQDLDIQEQKYNGLSDLVNDLGRITIIALSLALVLLFSGQAIASIGDIYFLIAMYTRILDPVSNILYRYDDIKWSEATSKTFLDLLQAHASVLVPAHRSSGVRVSLAHLSASQGKTPGIQFIDVSFHYKGASSTWVLRNCSFEAPANARTLVVGRSGSGKTTIARIILGFWPVNTGQVYVDGKALDAWNLAALREKMSYVAQGDHIIDDSVRDNLSWAYTTQPVSDDRMLHTLAEVGIIQNPQERALLDQPARNLSGGQQQRLSIARMMLDESPIVILDEPLTGVDVFTLHELLPILDKALRRPHRTVLMFSHNLALASYADHVVVLGDTGRVDEEGEPKHLLAKKGGIFATLYQTALNDLQVRGRFPALLRFAALGILSWRNLFGKRK